MDKVIVDTAKVLPKGQITLSKDFMEILGVKRGDRVARMSVDGEVLMMNPATYALRAMQKKMEGRAKEAGVDDEEGVVKLVREVRSDGDDS